jgi:hypothetical protein
MEAGSRDRRAQGSGLSLSPGTWAARTPWRPRPRRARRAPASRRVQ